MTALRPGQPLVARLLLAFSLGLLALLSSCGGEDIPPPGTPVVTFSATNTKFASYVVGIDSITLTGSNGYYAVPLASQETVDLARLSDLSELVEAPAVPSGSYTSATITLDYTYASVWAQDHGSVIQLTPLTSSGVATAVVNITFDPKHPLVITYGQSTRMAVNFDLDAFNSIDLADKEVIVNPFITINQPPIDKTPMRARGLFVYTSTNYFVMNVRPFFDLTSALGALYVNVSPQTYYNINGQTFVGDAGLAQLKNQQINSSVAVYGTLLSLNGITPTFNATTVIAGTSLEAQGVEDHIVGIVGARSGDTLTILGGDFLFSTATTSCYSANYPIVGLTYYLAKATVNLGSSTIVSRDGYAPAQTTDSISVGQEVDVGGISSCSTDGYVTLDATQTQARLTNTRIWGVLNTTASPTRLSLDILSLGLFDNSAFNFTGTATGGGGVPRANYVVDTNGLDATGYPASTQLAVDGFVTNFGTAPPAFSATAITPGASTEQSLVVEWGNGGTTKPFQSIHPDGLIIDLDNPYIGTVLGIYTGPESIDLRTLLTSPVITSVGAVQSNVVLAVGNNTLTTGVSTYQSMSDFATALDTVFAGTNKIFRLVAIGNYNSASNTFVATRISVSLQN